MSEKAEIDYEAVDELPEGAEQYKEEYIDNANLIKFHYDGDDTYTELWVRKDVQKHTKNK